jgi:HIRAN domain
VRRLRDGQRLSWETLPKSDGLEAMPIAGVKYRLAALQSSTVAPGEWLTLVPEPTNPNDPYAVGVWDLNRQQQIGYLPRREAKGVSSALQKREALRCFSLWENHTKKERVSLRVLVIGPNAKLLIPT